MSMHIKNVFLSKNIIKFMILSVVFIVFQLSGGSVNAASEMTDLGTLGGTYSNAYSINEMDQVVGESFDKDTRLKAFIWENGVMKDLGTGPNSSAKAINNKGQVVGFMTVNYRMHAFLWENGTITDLNPPGANASCAFDINEKGQIVGWVHIGMKQVAVVWENRIMRILYDSDTYLASADRINEKNQIIINCSSKSEYLDDYGFVLGNGVEEEVKLGKNLMALNEDCQVVGYKYLYDNGTISELSTLGGNSSAAYSINDKSEIVGSSANSANDHHAVIWRNGSIKDLGTLGGSSSCAMAINNEGHVVGNSSIGNSTVQHAFLYGRLAVNYVQNPGFESGSLTGWITSGGAFRNGDITAVRDYWGGAFNHQGNYHMWGYNEGGDGQTGTMRSTSFMLKGTAQGGCTVSFLTSGGNDINNLYVALVRASDDAILFKSTGENSETYHMINWDATKYIGSICYIKLLDNSTNPWGHINIDDVSIGDPRLPYNWVEDSGFETGDLTGWITSGDAFSKGDVTAVRDYWGGAFNHQGNYHMWGYNEGGDGQTGTMRSSAFKIQGSSSINFLISGGNDSNKLYVALVKASDGTILFKETGNNSETYRSITWNVSSYAGTDCYIMLVDNSTNPWGHINIDGIKFDKVS